MRRAVRDSDRQAMANAVLRALRDGVTVAEGRRRNAEDRWAEANADLARKRCGTGASEPAERANFWWNRD